MTGRPLAAVDANTNVPLWEKKTQAEVGVKGTNSWNGKDEVSNGR